MHGDRPNVLVMAVGSPLGQSILKALQRSDAVGAVHVSDIDDLAAGFYLGADHAVVLPPVFDGNYAEALASYIDEHQIQLVFPVIASEHDFFAQHSEEYRARGVSVITSGPDVFDLCSDKFESMRFLKSRGLAAPLTALCVPGSPLEEFLDVTAFPVFVKPRFGASSQGAVTAMNRRALFGMIDAAPSGSLVVQEYLSDDCEYTVGIYIARSAAFCDSIVIRRELKFGLSYRGSILIDQRISDYAERVASAVGAVHAVNVQLKVIDGVPTCFEINPRLSSTTSIRAHFGFNEPHMAVLDAQGKIEDYINTVRTGRFTRYWQEHYLEPA